MAATPVALCAIVSTLSRYQWPRRRRRRVLSVITSERLNSVHASSIESALDGRECDEA